MTLTGHSLIAGQPVVGAGKTTFGFNPATNEALEPTYTLITEEQLTTATSAAAEAYPSFSTLDPETHAAFLDAIADNIDARAVIERILATVPPPQPVWRDGNDQSGRPEFV